MKRRKKTVKLFRFSNRKWWRRGMAIADFLGGITTSISEQIIAKLISLLKVLSRCCCWTFIRINNWKKNRIKNGDDKKPIPQEATPEENPSTETQEALAALISLGVPKNNAQYAVTKASQILGSSPTVQQLITEALKHRRT